MQLGTFGSSLLGNILADKEINRAREVLLRAGYGSLIKSKDFFMLPHPLINFETRKYYQKKARFNRVYSIDNLPDKTNEAYVISILILELLGLLCMH